MVMSMFVGEEGGCVVLFLYCDGTFMAMKARCLYCIYFKNVNPCKIHIYSVGAVLFKGDKTATKHYTTGVL